MPLGAVNLGAGRATIVTGARPPVAAPPSVLTRVTSSASPFVTRAPAAVAAAVPPAAPPPVPGPSSQSRVYGPPAAHAVATPVAPPPAAPSPVVSAASWWRRMNAKPPAVNTAPSTAYGPDGQLYTVTNNPQGPGDVTPAQAQAWKQASEQALTAGMSPAQIAQAAQAAAQQAQQQLQGGGSVGGGGGGGGGLPDASQALAPAAAPEPSFWDKYGTAIMIGGAVGAGAWLLSRR